MKFPQQKHTEIPTDIKRNPKDGPTEPHTTSHTRNSENKVQQDIPKMNDPQEM